MIFIMPKAYRNFQFSTFNFSFGPQAEKRSFITTTQKIPPAYAGGIHWFQQI